MTADLERAMTTCKLEEAERFALISVPFLEDAGMQVSPQASFDFDEALDKLYYFLNFGIIA